MYYILAIPHGDHFVSMAGDCKYRIGKLAWRANGFHLYYSPTSAWAMKERLQGNEPQYQDAVILEVETSKEPSDVGMGCCVVPTITPKRAF